VTYIDSSVALAYLLAEARIPPAAFWSGELVSSRLLAYEVWNRIHARRLGKTLGGDVQSLLDGIELIELSEPVLARALEPWPITVRTLDALHLATVEYLRSRGAPVDLVSYDHRLVAAAQAVGIAPAAM
jgi:hypothetical protein